MAKQKEPPKQSQLSQERVEDSSDENESQPAESESESESESTSSNVEDDSKSSQANGRDDSETESTSSTVPRQKRPPSDATQISTRKKAKTITSTVQISAKPYKAPSGYEPLTLTASDYAADVATLFDDLTGKQIWHITVPDTISIESIKELDIQGALKGEAILSKNGVDYNMQSIPPRNEGVLLPQGTKSTYEQCPTKIQRSFHLREMIKKSQPQEKTSIVFTATATGKAKVIRKQPEGLKMRYIPYGATPLEEDAEDVDMDDAFQVPPEVPEPSPKKKSKKSKETNQDPTGGTSPETKKKAAADGQASIEKKKKKKRKLVDADVL